MSELSVNFFEICVELALAPCLLFEKLKGDEKLWLRKFIGVRCGVIELPTAMEFEREFKNDELRDCDSDGRRGFGFSDSIISAYE